MLPRWRGPESSKFWRSLAILLGFDLARGFPFFRFDGKMKPRHFGRFICLRFFRYFLGTFTLIIFKDELVWSMGSSKQHVRVKDIYASVSSSLAILFSSLVYYNRNLTWEVLQRKGWIGPGRCSMCCQASETNVHMFFNAGHRPKSGMIFPHHMVFLTKFSLLFRMVTDGGQISSLHGDPCSLSRAGTCGNGGMHASSRSPRLLSPPL